MRGKNFGTVPSPVVRLGGAAGGGPVLITRRYYRASITDTVPAGATRATARCIGSGGGCASTQISAAGGGGGAYARDDLPCSAGQNVAVTIGAAATTGNGQPTSVVLAGKTVLAAGGGAGGVGGYLNTGPGGQASASTGSVKRSGGASFGGGGSGDSGVSGGAGGTGTNHSGGGGSAGDRTDPDTLSFFGDGASTNVPAGVGGGATASASVIQSGPGFAVIEFWSA